MSIIIQDNNNIVNNNNNNNNILNANAAGNILNSRYGLQDISNKPILSSENTNNVVLGD